MDMDVFFKDFLHDFTSELNKCMLKEKKLMIYFQLLLLSRFAILKYLFFLLIFKLLCKKVALFKESQS